MIREKNKNTDSNHSNKLAERGLWDPELVAIISDVIGSPNIVSKTSVEHENYHFLEWENSSGKSDVMLEIHNDVAYLRINRDRYRPAQERMALGGIAARYGLKLDEYLDIDLEKDE